ATPPYLIVRDVKTGCAYSAAYVQQHLLYPPSNPNAPNAATPATAVLSRQDLSQIYPGRWMDADQQTQHTNDAALTSQLCYANGDAVPDNQYPYKVAWARSAEWNGSPGPD